MLPMRSMVLSKSKPWKSSLWKCVAGGFVPEDIRMVLAQVFAGGHQEAGRAAGRVADDVLRRGRGHLDHELDDVAAASELAVLPRGGDLRSMYS